MLWYFAVIAGVSMLALLAYGFYQYYMLRILTAKRIREREAQGNFDRTDGPSSPPFRSREPFPTTTGGDLRSGRRSQRRDRPREPLALEAAVLENRATAGGPASYSSEPSELETEEYGHDNGGMPGGTSSSSSPNGPQRAARRRSRQTFPEARPAPRYPVPTIDPELAQVVAVPAVVHEDPVFVDAADVYGEAVYIARDDTPEPETTSVKVSENEK